MKSFHGKSAEICREKSEVATKKCLKISNFLLDSRFFGPQGFQV
jgi:hypothetical protein